MGPGKLGSLCRSVSAREWAHRSAVADALVGCVVDLTVSSCVRTRHSGAG